MISSTHITTGAAFGLAVGSIIPNQAIAIPIAIILGIASHHLLDMIPHTDPGSFRKEGENGPPTKKEIIFALPDNIIGTAIVLYIFFTHHPSWPMLFGAVGGNLPDVWHNVGTWSDLTREIWPGYFHFHEGNHWTARDSLIPFGIITNAAIIILATYYLFL